MWRFYLGLLPRVPKLAFDSADLFLKGFAILVFVITLFNRPLAQSLTNWEGISPSWALVPVGLLFVYGLARANYERFREVQRESAADARAGAQERRARNETLQAYFDQMGSLLLREDGPPRGSEAARKASALARSRTLAVLQGLDSEGKRGILRFLHDSRLMENDLPLILLEDADLTEARLTRMSLIYDNLNGARLSGADLSGATFSVLQGTGADLIEAERTGTSLAAFETPTAASSLQGANLSGAVLRVSRLAGCNLMSADLAGADLDRADLRGADLRFTRNLTQDQIDSAYGGADPQRQAQYTMLPEYLQAPASWAKSIDVQQRERAGVEEGEASPT